jgi:3-phenylpropionate/cinnamic acid dioxygenase small subunit
MSNEKLTRRLHEEVVIGARAVEPAPSPHTPQPLAIRPVARGVAGPAERLQEHVEQFLYHQSELLDAKHWQDYIDLFAADGIYWMPVTPEQTEWRDSPSIFAEDRAMMSIRMGRVMHPNAWSQAPMWGTSHTVGNVVIESATDDHVTVRSRFHMVELRRDTQRQFAGTYRHTLLRVGEDFRIQLQRVDLLSSQAIFDYVLQVWV